MTVLLPKGRRGLKAPMRSERPAAKSIAATSIHELIERFWSAPAERSSLGALDGFCTSLRCPEFEQKTKRRRRFALPAHSRAHYFDRKSSRARSVYWRAICLRQFITKSVLSRGRAFT